MTPQYEVKIQRTLSGLCWRINIIDPAPRVRASIRSNRICERAATLYRYDGMASLWIEGGCDWEPTPRNFRRLTNLLIAHYA